MSKSVIKFAIVSLASVEVIALLMGHNGMVLMMVFAIIGGLAGYKVNGVIKNGKRNRKE